MTDQPAHPQSVKEFVRKQMIVSIIISMAISAAFFLAIYRMMPVIAVWDPDYLAFDFLPQAFFASFMAALMPSLKTRSALALGQLPGLPPSTKTIVLRALAYALLGLGMAGIAITVLKLGGFVSFRWATAFAIKVAFGAMLGTVITPAAVRAVLTKG